MWYNTRAAEKTGATQRKNLELTGKKSGAFSERIGEGDSERCDERKAKRKSFLKTFEKPLDKRKELWYNNKVGRKELTTTFLPNDKERKELQKNLKNFSKTP